MTMNGISEEKYTHIDEIKEQTKAVFDELMEQAKLEEGDILVVGCSSSEIASHRNVCATASPISALEYEPIL